MCTDKDSRPTQVSDIRSGLGVPRVLVCTTVLLLLAGGHWLCAQGIERQSLAGESAAEAARGSDTNQPYNLQLGPVTLRADASLSASYNDNIDIAHTGRISDVILTPNLNLHALWQATDLNALTFDLGIGYDWYTMHSGNSALTISPSSQTQFNIYAGDFKINLHDRFSFSQDPIAVAQLSNVNEFPVFVNVAGLQVDWDLTDVILSLGYDHTNQWVFDRNYDYLNYQSDTVSPRVTVKIDKLTDAGLATSFSSQRYDQNIQNDNTTFMVGPFVSSKLNEDLSIRAEAGGQFTNYDKGGLNGDTSNLAAFYGNLGVTHRINEVLTETLTGGREFLPGISSNNTQRIYADYTFNWQATSYLSVGTNLWWENLEDSDATFSEKSNRYGAGLTLAYNLNDHATINLGYQYILKDANPSIDSYSQNVVTLTFLYHF